MRLASPFLAVPFRFDAGRLLEEVLAFDEHDWLSAEEAPATHATLPLIAAEQAAGSDGPPPLRATELLRRSPYLRQVIASFDSIIGSAALVRERGPAEPPLRSAGGSYWLRRVRIHVPIVTSPSVRFDCGEQSLAMEAGDAWIFDTWLPHAVRITDAALRLDLIVDMHGSAAFWRLVDVPRRRRLIEYVPDKDARLRMERRQHPSPRSPQEQEEIFKLILDAFPGQGDALKPLRNELTRFVHEWRAVWSLHADGPDGWPFLTELRDELEERVAAYEGAVTLSNGIDATAAVRSALGDQAFAIPIAARATVAIPSAAPASRPPPAERRLPVQTNEALMRAVCTEEFVSILDREGVSLVVSTGRPGRVVIIRAEPPRASLSARQFRSPFGIACRGDRIVIGTEREIWDFANDTSVAARIAGSPDACFLPRGTRFTGVIAIHEIAFAGEELWFVNTLFSTLCTLDERYSFRSRWHPRFVASPTPEDACHLNGLAIGDDRVKLASAFGDSSDPAGWRGRHRDSGLLIDVPSGEIAVRGLCVPHSPRLRDGHTFVLESWKGTLASVDLDPGRLETVAEPPGFTRGLAFWGPFAFVGLSKVRPGAAPMPLLDRTSETECGIRVVDLRSGRDVASLQFTAGATEIFDVQVIELRAPELLEPRSALAGSMFALP